MTWKEPPPRDYEADPIRSPVKAIRAKCLDCCCWVQAEVVRCDIKTCPLWPFRMGKNPFRAIVSEAHREAARRNIAAAQAARHVQAESSAGGEP